MMAFKLFANIENKRTEVGSGLYRKIGKDQFEAVVYIDGRCSIYPVPPTGLEISHATYGALEIEYEET